MEIIEGKLYFIKDEFIEKYNPKYHLMENKFSWKKSSFSNSKYVSYFRKIHRTRI